jgi:hypothetical protein
VWFSFLIEGVIPFFVVVRGVGAAGPQPSAPHEE